VRKIKQKTLFILILLGAGVFLTFKTVQALFSDSETSSDNVLGAATFDLQLANTATKNGAIANNSWSLGEEGEHLFFNSQDLLPGDWGQNLVELNLNNDQAWLCAHLQLTQNSENGLEAIEEAAGDLSDGNWAGELATSLQLFFWADDGDNIWETNEKVILQQNAAKLPQGDNNAGQRLNLIDAQNNAFGSTLNQPWEAAKGSLYLGQIWCLGELTVSAAEPGATEAGTINCNGSEIDNRIQSDLVQITLNFYAVQARHNDNFSCQNWEL